MAHADKAVYAAMAGNIAVAAVKFTAAGLSGSSAMLAEAVHSVVDTGDNALLLLGRRRSRRPPDEDHPVGHGQELYFWSFVVAIMVFAVGAGFSLYEGVTRILHPGDLESPLWNYLVLSMAAVFEGTSLAVGYRQFRKEAGDRSLWQTLRESKDPPTFSVVLEDSAALVGIAMAFLGIWLSQVFRDPVFDGAASLAIGCLLTAVSIVLARESKGLLLGEAMARQAREDIRRIVRECDGVSAAQLPLTLYFGPQFILLAIKVEFARHLTGQEVTATVALIEAAIRDRYPKIQRIYIEAGSLTKTPRLRETSGHRV